MATPALSSFPWRRFQFAVGLWAQRCLGVEDADRAVVWADFNVQRPALPYLSLQVTGGPNRRSQDAEQWPRYLPSAVTVQVTADAVASPGDVCNLFVNGELFSHVALAGETADDVRDDLLARVGDSVELGVEVAGLAPDSFTLHAARPGSLVVEAAIGCTAAVTATQLVALTVGAREVRVRATAYGAPEPRVAGQVSVAEWIERLVEGTQDPDIRLELRRLGYVVTRTVALQQRVTAPSGADREPRAAVDLLFAGESRRGRVVEAWLGEVATPAIHPVAPPDA